MPHFLPAPDTPDVWQTLREQTRPILVYGMGNGADKLFSRFEREGITVADVFASDGFVRGHSYRGFRVKSFSEIREIYSDFVIVLSFASSRLEVIERLCELDRDYDLYIPDMPVSGEAYFDSAFYRRHYGELSRAMDALDDDRSRALFAAVVTYKLTGRLSYLLQHTCAYEEIARALDAHSVRSYLDGGAYTGDTLRLQLSHSPRLSRAHLVEPDPKTYRRLLRTLSELSTGAELLPYNAALSDADGELLLHGSGNRNSSTVGASYQYRDTMIAARSVDSLLGGEAVDFIKLDVEGAELMALRGAHGAILTHRPRLLISLYHRSEDVFSLILYMKERYPFYRLQLYRTPCVPAWELDLIALPT